MEEKSAETLLKEMKESQLYKKMTFVRHNNNRDKIRKYIYVFEDTLRIVGYSKETINKFHNLAFRELIGCDVPSSIWQ